MSLVLAQGLSLAYGKKVLLQGASFAVGPRDRIGLIGPNGTGKSTLLKILVGQVTPDSGTVRLTRQAKIGYLPQELSKLEGGPLLEQVLNAVPGREELERKLKALEEALAASRQEAEQLELSQSLADLHFEFDHFEERYGRHRAERILRGLGFSRTDMGRPVGEFSGGWRMRAALAGLLLQDPELLLLDEPTNHLDLPTLSWFDDFLRSSNKARVIISHDREFLNRQIDRVLSLEVEGLRSYAGNLNDYEQQRVQEIEQLEAQYERQSARRAEIEAFINRFRAKSSKARQVQSRIKLLEKQETVELREERATVQFRFPEVERSGREVAQFTDISKRFGQNVVYEGLEARIERGQRVAVVGVNGAGKTTLLKILCGELPADGGTVALGHNVVMGYYAQHHADTLDRNATVLDEVRKVAPRRSDTELRSVLGAFLFSGDDVDKRIGVLSGGERARVALARLLVTPANFLVMDEPTNHLDLDSSEALIEALSAFSGTLLFVSHNRSFLNQLATHIWEVKDRKVTPYPGNLDDYLFHLREAAKREEGEGADGKEAASAAAIRKGSEKERKRLEAEERQRRHQVEGPLKKKIATLEERISALEAQQSERDAQLADPALYNDFERARPVMDAHRETKSELEGLYASWEAAQEELAALQREGSRTS